MVRRAEGVQLENAGKLLILEAAARYAMRQRRELLARHFDVTSGVLLDEAHGVDRIVERRRNAAEHTADRLERITFQALGANKILDRLRRQGGKPMLAEGGLNVQAQHLLAKLDRVVADGKACAFEPQIKVVGETQTGVARLCAAVLVDRVGLYARKECLLLCGEAAALGRLSLAADGRLLEAVAPFPVAAADMDFLGEIFVVHKETSLSIGGQPCIISIG